MRVTPPCLLPKALAVRLCHCNGLLLRLLQPACRGERARHERERRRERESKRRERGSSHVTLLKYVDGERGMLMERGATCSAEENRSFSRISAVSRSSLDSRSLCSTRKEEPSSAKSEVSTFVPSRSCIWYLTRRKTCGCERSKGARSIKRRSPLTQL